MRQPSIKDFLFATQVKSLYRNLVKTAYLNPDPSSRAEILNFYKHEFKELTTPEESKMRFNYLRNSVGSLGEMLRRSHKNLK